MKIVLILAIYLLTLQVRRYRLARFFHTQVFAREACAMLGKADKLWLQDLSDHQSYLKFVSVHLILKVSGESFDCKYQRGTRLILLIAGAWLPCH